MMLARFIALHCASAGKKFPNHDGTRLGFAPDSPQEGSGFELPVPREIALLEVGSRASPGPSSSPAARPRFGTGGHGGSLVL